MVRFGTWIGSFFVYRPPQFGFRPSEQRLLLAASGGRTDEDITETLEISLSAVKKTWRSIYERVTAQSPGLIPDHVPEELTSERGKEKSNGCSPTCASTRKNFAPRRFNGYIISG